MTPCLRRETKLTVRLHAALTAFFVVFGCFFAVPAHAANRLTDIRHWSSPTFTRVVLDLGQEARYDSFSLNNPERIVIDLASCDERIPEKLLRIADGIVKTVRVSAQPGGKVRIVIDLEKKSAHKIFPLKAIGKKPPRLVVDISRPELEQAMRDRREETRRQKKRGEYIVVVDPGHGGEDPGAVSRRGTKEKDIVFSIARQVVRHLNRKKGIKAYLTRKGDYFISLRKRVEIAKQYGADIFISIHADSSFSSKVAGSSVYCLSFKGASSNTAKLAAKKENASDFVGGVPLDDRNNDLNTIIFDLVQTHSLNSSLKLAGLTLHEIAKVNRLHTKRVQQANFAVLRAPDIPSILIETDFISNRSREKRLQSTWFQKELSKNIASAVARFIEGSEDAVYYARPHSRYHTVKKGETLSGIAQTYGTTVSTLAKLNGLSSRSTLHAGKKLKIPSEARPLPEPADTPAFHRVRRGETLSGIAEKYGTTVAGLRRLNNLSKRSVLRAGAKLKLKETAGQPHSPQRDADTGTRYTFFHRVKGGETLSGIAEKYGIRLAALCRLNNISRNSTLRVGQKLKVPESTGGRTAVSYAYHTVRRGETLSGIAEKYGIRLAALCRLNNISRNSTLRVGQKLKVPESTGGRTAVSYAYHTVRRGETLSGIAEKYGARLAALCRLNNLSTKSTLRIGKKLKVPAGRRSEARQRYVYHTVRRGETLSGIAEKYGTTVGSLCRLNDLSVKSVLRAGKKLKILTKS